jgi:hypothetical protein
MLHSSLSPMKSIGPALCGRFSQSLRLGLILEYTQGYLLFASCYFLTIFFHRDSVATCYLHADVSDSASCAVVLAVMFFRSSDCYSRHGANAVSVQWINSIDRLVLFRSQVPRLPPRKIDRIQRVKCQCLIYISSTWFSKI